MTLPAIFSTLALLACLYAAVSGRLQNSVLGLWAAGLAVGAIYLSFGAEYLAILQWVVSTLIAIGSMFFVTVMHDKAYEEDTRPTRQRVLPIALSLLLAAGFVGVAWIGLKDLAGEQFLLAGSGAVGASQRLSFIGKLLTENHVLSLEVLAITLLMVLVGSAVIARLELGPREREPIDGIKPASIDGIKPASKEQP
jgi:NADH:ubiquinone oxidoreductase subunit 6 (subunit J)